MGLTHSSKISTDGLVFLYDLANQKSWKGKPTVNVVTNTDLNTGWSQGYQTNIVFNEIAPPQGISSPTVGFDRGQTSGYWYSYGNYAPQVPGTEYTVSLYVKTLDPNFTIRFYTADNSEVGRYGSSYIPVPNDGNWYRIVWPSFVNSIDSQSDSLSFQFTFNDAIGSPTTRTWFCAPQMEVGSFASPFVIGERTDTQSVFDLTKKSTLRANSLTYLADETFEFDGTSSYVDINNGLYGENIPGKTVIAVVSMDDNFGDPTTAFYRGILGTNAASAFRNFNFYVRSSTSGFQLHFSEGNGTVAVGGLSDLFNMAFDQPFFIAASHEGNGTLKYYLNGEVLTHTTQTFYQPNTGVSEYLGIPGTYWKGFIYNASVYHKALSEDEIKQIYLSQKTRFGL